MKISKLFHWLYFVVMMLPVFVLPIFALAVRSDNNYQPIEVEVDKNVPITFNQLFYNGDFSNGTSGYSFSNNSSPSISDNVLTVTPVDADVLGYRYFYSSSYLTYHADHSYVFRFYYSYPQTAGRNVTFRLNTGDFDSLYTSSLNYSDALSFYSYRVDFTDTYSLKFQFVYDAIPTFSISDICVFDLTMMFGSGNEPTTDVFNSYFSLPYYDYDLGSSSLLFIEDYVYNDTDFGSQTIYTLYKEVDAYFNYDDVLSIGELYEWCEINLFNGNATLGFFIFFHLLEYWLLTSLLWLIFDILMYVPQLCHRWLDKASLE